MTRPIREVRLDRVSGLDDEALALSELSLDRYFSRIPLKDHPLYVGRSLEIGGESAIQYAGQNPWELAEHLGVRVGFSNADAKCAGAVRAEYDSGTQSITLFLHAIDAFQKRLEQIGFHSRLAEAGSDRKPSHSLSAAVHAAHELFHHLESTTLGRVDNRLPRVTVCNIGRFGFGWARIRRCREIAAHKFAKDLLGLPSLPNAIDLFMDGQSDPFANNDNGVPAWTKPLQV